MVRRFASMFVDGRYQRAVNPCERWQERVPASPKRCFVALHVRPSIALLFRVVIQSLLKRMVPRVLYPSAVLRRSVQRQTGLRVCGGPFRGMNYVERSIWGAYIPKLTGTYELEVHPFIEQAIASRPAHVIDIGAAEGYYAVGLLVRLPDARLTAFEQLEDGRQTLARLARDNGVANRLEILGACDPAALRRCLEQTQARLIVCDVEGYETELLDPDKIPELAGVDLLVEVHDSIVPNCREQMASRFAATHDVMRVPQRPRTLEQYPLRHAFVRLWPSAIVKYGLNEFRSPQNSWLWLRAKRDRVDG